MRAVITFNNFAIVIQFMLYKKKIHRRRNLLRHQNCANSWHVFETAHFIMNPRNVTSYVFKLIVFSAAVGRDEKKCLIFARAWREQTTEESVESEARDRRFIHQKLALLQSADRPLVSSYKARTRVPAKSSIFRLVPLFALRNRSTTICFRTPFLRGTTFQNNRWNNFCWQKCLTLDYRKAKWYISTL